MSHIPSIGVLFSGWLKTISETFPPKCRFDPDKDIPDLSGRVAIVTGGNSGIGKETAKHLLLHGAKVYLACRSAEKAAATYAELTSLTGRSPIFMKLDLASLASITEAAEWFKGEEPALHMLFNSAGVMTPPVEFLTKDGYDLQWGTNVLGHAHLTLLLIPQLITGAKSSRDGKARVINVSSAAMYFVGAVPWVWKSLGPNADPALRKTIKSGMFYVQSKLANAVFSNELARRYADQGIISNALNPGTIATNLYQHTFPFVQWFMNKISWPMSPYGALTSLYAGTSLEAKDLNSAWLVPWARVGDAGPIARDPKLGEELWNWIEEQREAHQAM